MPFGGSVHSAAPLERGDTGLSQTGAGGAISPDRTDGSGRGCRPRAVAGIPSATATPPGKQCDRPWMGRSQIRRKRPPTVATGRASAGTHRGLQPSVGFYVLN